MKTALSVSALLLCSSLSSAMAKKHGVTNLAQLANSEDGETHDVSLQISYDADGTCSCTCAPVLVEEEEEEEIVEEEDQEDEPIYIPMDPSTVNGQVGNIEDLHWMIEESLMGYTQA